MPRLWIKSGEKDKPVYLPLAEIPEDQSSVETEKFGRVTVDAIEPGEKNEQRVAVHIERYHGHKKPSIVTVSDFDRRGRFLAPITGALIEVILDEPPHLSKKK